MIHKTIILYSSNDLHHMVYPQTYDASYNVSSSMHIRSKLYIITFHLSSAEAYQVLCHSLYNHQFQMDQSVDMVVVQVKIPPNK